MAPWIGSAPRLVIVLVLLLSFLGFEAERSGGENGVSFGGGFTRAQDVQVLLEDDDDEFCVADDEVNKEEVFRIDADGADEEDPASNTQKKDLDMYVVATVDGCLHAINPHSKTFWSSAEIGGPIVKSYQSVDAELEGAAIVSEDGLLYLYSEATGLVQHPMSIPDLVAASPFTESLGVSQSKMRVVGERKTTFYELDPNTGKRLRVLSSESGSLTNERWENPSSPTDKSSNVFPMPFQGAPPITIGRVDYCVRAFRADTGKEVWNLTYSEFKSSSGASSLPDNSNNNVERKLEMLDARTALEFDMPGSTDASGVPERFTMAGIPVTSVFSAHMHTSSRHTIWEIATQQTIRHKRNKRLATSEEEQQQKPEEEDIYLQRMRFPSGEHQVYASNAKVGRPLPYSVDVFPAFVEKRTNGALEMHSTEVVPAPDDEVDSGEMCIATSMDADFPLQGPHRVVRPSVILDEDRLTAEDTAKFPGLPALPRPEKKNVDNNALAVIGDLNGISKNSNPLSPEQIEQVLATLQRPKPKVQEDVRNLQILVALLLAVVGLLVFMSSNSTITMNNLLGILGINSNVSSSSVVGSSKSSSPTSSNARVPEFDCETNTERVGDLVVSLDAESLLGRGAGGTTVLKGSLRGRPVAVKKVLSSQFKLAEKEIDLLIRSDEHPNIVRYFHTEMTRDFIFLALELCDSSLEQAVTCIREVNTSRKAAAPKGARKNLRIASGSLKFLRALASATNHLHNLRIVHCDIKPANILVVKTADMDTVQRESDELLIGVGDVYDAKLSDMGLGRKFVGNTSSIYGGTSIQGSGTIGWRCPELMRGLTKNNNSSGNYSSASSGSGSGSCNDIDEHDVAIRLGRKVDVFSMGCVFFFIISGGHHPFGEHLDRERNILKGEPVNLGRMVHFPLAHDLIKKMVDTNPEARPSMEVVLEHPLLWEPAKKLEFLKQVSDRLEADRANDSSNNYITAFSVPESLLHEHLEERAVEVVGKQGWLQRLHPVLRQDVVESKRRYYTTHSLRDLLRYIRNRLSHLRELDEGVRELLSPVPEGFLNQFLGSNRFPLLLLTCYEFVLQTCAGEPEFETLLGACIVAKHAESSKTWQARQIANQPKFTPTILNLKSRKQQAAPDGVQRSETVCATLSDDNNDDVTTPSSPVPRSTSLPNPAPRPPPGFEETNPEEEINGMNWRSSSPPRNVGGYPAAFPPMSSPPPGFPISQGRTLSMMMSNSTNKKSSSPNPFQKQQTQLRSPPLTRGHIPGSTYVGDPKLDPQYKTRTCLFFDKPGKFDGTACKQGDACFFAHGAAELRSQVMK